MVLVNVHEVNSNQITLIFSDKIYFSSNVRFYIVMNRSNFWSMELFQTGPHFKLEEV